MTEQLHWLVGSPWTIAHQARLSSTLSQSLLKLMSTESVMPSNHPILFHPLLLQHSIFPSIRVFSSESALCIRWPKYRSFCFSNRPSNDYSGLISFRTDWCLESRMGGLIYLGISSPAPVPATGQQPHRREEKGMTVDEIVGWQHQLNGHEFEQTLGESKGQGSLVCCSPWSRKELDITERLNNNTVNSRVHVSF